MMKRVVSAIAFVGLFALLSPSKGSADGNVSISFFHQALAPHGDWVVAGRYGEVWQPVGVGPDWQPYLDGEWIYTDYGWTWASYDPWGDLTYRYGTWVIVEPHGWVWIPGFVWAPAWVTWAYTDDYVGWAPVPYTFGLSLTGYAGPPVVVSRTRYVFVPARRFVGVRSATVRVPARQNAVILTRARKATDFSVSGGIVRNSGLSVQQVERLTRGPIRRASLPSRRFGPTAVTAAVSPRGKTVAVVAPARQRARAVERKKGDLGVERARPKRGKEIASPRPRKPGIVRERERQIRKRPKLDRGSAPNVRPAPERRLRRELPQRETARKAVAPSRRELSPRVSRQAARKAVSAPRREFSPRASRQTARKAVASPRRELSTRKSTDIRRIQGRKQSEVVRSREASPRRGSQVEKRRGGVRKPAAQAAPSKARDHKQKRKAPSPRNR